MAAAGIVTKNTKCNNQWTLRNFEAWREHYNGLHPEAPCREDVLLTSDASELDNWLSVFVLETRKEDGSPFPPKSIKLILSGLLRYMRAKSPSPFNIFQKDDHRFRKFRATCDTIFKQLHASGVGAHVKHQTNFGKLVCLEQLTLRLSKMLFFFLCWQMPLLKGRRRAP